MSLPETLIRIGTLYKPHGVRGEIKMYPETDDPERLQDLKEVQIGKTSEKTRSFQIRSLRLHRTAKHDFVLLVLENVNNPDEANALKGQGVYVQQNVLPPLEDDEYWLDDLVGMTARTEDGEIIGEVVEWLEGPAHDLMVILRPDESEVLIPLVPAFITDVDSDENCVVIRPIEGLLD